MGETVKVGDLDLLIEGVERVDTKTFNRFNEANVRVRIHAMNARGREDDTYRISMLAFSLVDGTGIAHSQAIGCAGCPDEVSGVNLTRGGSIKGNVYFEVPTGSTLKEVRYEPPFSGNKAFIGLGQ